MSNRIKPEVLAPAGDFERLQAAVKYGADAVYLGATSFGMRANAGNFNEEELRAGVKFAHEHGVRVYLTCNILPTNEEADRLPEAIKDRRYYEPGDNKNEQAFAQYWKMIKGE